MVPGPGATGRDRPGINYTRRPRPLTPFTRTELRRGDPDRRAPQRGGTVYLAPPRLGQPPKPVKLGIGPASMVWKLPLLHCTAAQLAKVSAVMGRTVTKDEVRAAILEAGEQGKDLAEEAWFTGENRVGVNISKKRKSRWL